MQRIDVEKNTILLCLTGSRLYGLDTPESDYDYRGICIPPIKYFIGTSNFEQMDSFVDNSKGHKNDYRFPFLTKTDTTIYGISKYIQLALDNNPNILEILWASSDYYIYKNELADRLINLKELFLSQKVYNTYLGYAKGQIRKLNKHKKWLDSYKADPNFYSQPPNPKDFDLEDNPLRKEQVNAYLEFLYVLLKDASQYHDVKEEVFDKFDFKGVLIQKPLQDYLFKTSNSMPLPKFIRSIWAKLFSNLPVNPLQYYTRSTNDFMLLLHNTQRYKVALQEFTDFHSWKDNRNERRAKLEAICGYDSISASHSYRIFKSGIEILEGKGVIANRRGIDADFILDIKQGKIDYDTLISKINSFDDQFKLALKNTNLPKLPDRNTIEDEMISIIKDYLL
jgi:predicted nucleotidyltransferase